MSTEYTLNFPEDLKQMNQEEILENEGNLLSDLLELANRKDNEAFYREIEIKVEGKVKARFRLRPLTADEVERCVKQATKYVKRPKGKPEKELNARLYQSILIYTATVLEDQKKIWENVQLKQSLDVLDNFDTVDKLLLPGEKSAVMEVISEMGGFDQEADTISTTAKN